MVCEKHDWWFGTHCPKCETIQPDPYAELAIPEFLKRDAENKPLNLRTSPGVLTEIVVTAPVTERKRPWRYPRSITDEEIEFFEAQQKVKSRNRVKKMLDKKSGITIPLSGKAALAMIFGKESRGEKTSAKRISKRRSSKSKA